MSSLTSIEKRQLEDAFDMSGGHVLDFTVRELDEAVMEATGKNLADEKYCDVGTSKAKRLRSFWAQESDQLVSSVIRSFADYAEAFDLAGSNKVNVCRRISQRLDGKEQMAEGLTKKKFLEEKLPDVCFDRLTLEGGFVPVMEQRWSEAKACMDVGAYLSVVLLLGSMLEGILLGAAQASPQRYNQARSAPKDDDGKVLPFWRWNLAALIDCSHEVGSLKLDVKKFSHALRDFRNYVHPYEQKASGFHPDVDTARVCLQVFRAAVNQLSMTTS